MEDHLEIINQLPPNDESMEILVLGGALKDKEALAIVISSLLDKNRTRKFYQEKHQFIFDAIADLYEAGEAVDVATVSNKLEETGKLDFVGGRYEVTGIVHKVQSTVNIESHCRKLNELALRRSLIAACQITMTRCFEKREKIKTILNEHSSEIFDFQIKKRDDWTTLADAATSALDNLHTAKATGQDISGIPTGFTDLDEMTGGLQRGDLIVVGGRPSMGKTAFMMSLAQQVAERGYYAAVFSLEMTALSLALRALSSKSRMNSKKFRVLRYLSMDDLKKLATILAVNVETWQRIKLQDVSGLTPIEMRARLKRLIAQNPQMAGNLIFFVDYTQIITSGKKYSSREQEISFISSFLKRIAKEFEMPGIAFSQLNRAVESRGGDNRPRLSDLRESGAIEQDADGVWFLFRPEYYGEKDKPNLAEVIISKQRNGAVGTVELYFAKEFTLFSNYEKRQDADNGRISQQTQHTGDPF